MIFSRIQSIFIDKVWTIITLELSVRFFVQTQILLVELDPYIKPLDFLHIFEWPWSTKVPIFHLRDAFSKMSSPFL